MRDEILLGVITPRLISSAGIVLVAIWCAALWQATQGAAASVLTAVIAAVLTIALTWIGAARVRRGRDHANRLERENHSLGEELADIHEALNAAGFGSGQSETGPSGMPPIGLSRDLLVQMRAAWGGPAEAIRRLVADQRQAGDVLARLDSGVIVVDAEGRVVLANPAARKFFGIRREPVGQPLVESVRHPELLSTFREAQDDRSDREALTELRDDQGHRRVLRVLCVPLTGAADSAVLIAARDESELRGLEAMRREFVANVSHELKTPLAAIKGYAETVQLAIGDDPEAAMHFVNQIQDQCRRLERLVSDMMTLARAQAGSHHLRPTTVDLSAVIAESIETYLPVAAAKSIELLYEPGADGSVKVHADREATLTIVNNLVGNAVRYTSEGGRVEASARRESDYGVLAVRDNGIGIPEHEQKRVFERFYRAEKSRTSATAGTGLGLAIVKNLTQAQDGRIHLESDVGSGSTFEIYLPTHPPALKHEAVTAGTAEADGASP